MLPKSIKGLIAKITQMGPKRWRYIMHSVAKDGKIARTGQFPKVIPPPLPHHYSVALGTRLVSRSQHIFLSFFLPKCRLSHTKQKTYFVLLATKRSTAVNAWHSQISVLQNSTVIIKCGHSEIWKSKVHSHECSMLWPNCFLFVYHHGIGLQGHQNKCSYKLQFRHNSILT